MPTLYWCPHQVLKATSAPVMILQMIPPSHDTFVWADGTGNSYYFYLPNNLKSTFTEILINYLSLERIKIGYKINDLKNFPTNYFDFLMACLCTGLKDSQQLSWSCVMMASSLIYFLLPNKTFVALSWIDCRYILLGLPRPSTIAETIESGPLCITDLFQNKSVAYFFFIIIFLWTFLYLSKVCIM